MDGFRSKGASKCTAILKRLEGGLSKKRGFAQETAPIGQTVQTQHEHVGRWSSGGYFLHTPDK